MADREKVIKGLECHVNLLKCHDCPYVDAIHPNWGCHLEELIADALTLLRERMVTAHTLSMEDVKKINPPRIPTEPMHISRKKETVAAHNELTCPYCGFEFKGKYCPNCGRKVK